MVGRLGASTIEGQYDIVAQVGECGRDGVDAVWIGHGWGSFGMEL